MALVGLHNIQTSGGQFLSLAAPGAAVTLVNVAAGNNQVWDFQHIEGNVYALRNVGQTAFAQSALAPDAPITGAVAAMNWNFIANGGGFSVRPAANNNFRWGIDGGAVNLLNLAGDVPIQNAHRFTVL